MLFFQRQNNERVRKSLTCLDKQTFPMALDIMENLGKKIKNGFAQSVGGNGRDLNGSDANQETVLLNSLH